MGHSRIKFAVSIYIITIGIAWLLNVLSVVPEVNWIWTAGLAVLGVLIMYVWGVNKHTFIMSPFLVIASICSLLKQIGKLDAAKEVPILTIVLGCLFLMAQLLKSPDREIIDSSGEIDE